MMITVKCGVGINGSGKSTGKVKEALPCPSFLRGCPPAHPHALRCHARESGHPVHRSTSSCPQTSAFTGSRLRRDDGSAGGEAMLLRRRSGQALRCFRPGTAGPLPLLDALTTCSDVIPAKAGIQYAAVPRLVRRHQCLLGPGFRRDDGSAGGEAVLLQRRSGQALQCFRPGTAGPLPLLDALTTRSDAMPAKAGIQYAAAPRLVRRRRRLLGPGFRWDDGSAGGEAVLLWRRSGQALRCFRPGTAGPLPLLDDLTTRSDVIPATAGTQYAAVLHLVRQRRCFTLSGFRRDGCAGGEASPPSTT